MTLFGTGFVCWVAVMFGMGFVCLCVGTSYVWHEVCLSVQVMFSMGFVCFSVCTSYV